MSGVYKKINFQRYSLDDYSCLPRVHVIKRMVFYFSDLPKCSRLTWTLGIFIVFAGNFAFRMVRWGNCGFEIGDWGVSATGKSFRVVPCVRAGVRAVWLPSGIGSQRWLPLFPLVPFGAPNFCFSLLGALNFPFLFPFPHPPNLLSNFSWAYRYRRIVWKVC